MLGALAKFLTRRSKSLSNAMFHFFRPREIYHRAKSVDGTHVVHYINMSRKTQIALSIVIAAAMLWLAYASVRVVFAGQIISIQAENIERLKMTVNQQSPPVLKPNAPPKESVPLAGSILKSAYQ